MAIQNSRIAVAVSWPSPPPQPGTSAGTDAGKHEATKTMSRISVEATEPEETPKVDRVSSPKFTQDLLDTPQTIAVVSQRSAAAAGRHDIVTGAAQHTRASRSCWARTAIPPPVIPSSCAVSTPRARIFIDGIRDLGTVTRDTFNTEQMEIAKGPAGPDYGRGAASGYVNLASKVPATETSTPAARATARPITLASPATSITSSAAAAPRSA